MADVTFKHRPLTKKGLEVLTPSPRHILTIMIISQHILYNSTPQ